MVLSSFNLSFKNILNFNKKMDIEKTVNYSSANSLTAAAVVNARAEEKIGLEKIVVQEMIRRDQLFISYCHKDKSWLDKLSPYLTSIENFNGIKAWSDKGIRPSEEWDEAIAKALDSAKVAVFLVSQHFLASKYIMEREMNYFLEINKSQKVPIFWIAISSCLFDDSPLKRIQCANDPHKPLDILSEAEQNKEITKICRNLQRLFKETKLEEDKTIPTAVTFDEKQNDSINSIKNNTNAGNKIHIQITIDSDFDSYSETELKAFLAVLKSLLSIYGDIKIVSKKRGSVLLTLELDYKDAEKIYNAINEGKFRKWNAISAKVIVLPYEEEANEYNRIQTIIHKPSPLYFYELLEMRYRDNLSIEEISKKLDRSQDIIKSELARTSKLFGFKDQDLNIQSDKNFRDINKKF